MSDKRKGLIRNQTRKAFERYQRDNSVKNLILNLVDIADIHVRAQFHRNILDNEIKDCLNEYNIK